MVLDIDAVAIRQRRWWRHTVRGADPLARRLPPSDNRWQHGAIVEAIYLANDEATVWAEWYRHLAEVDIPPVDGRRQQAEARRADPIGLLSHGALFLPRTTHANQTSAVGRSTPANSGAARLVTARRLVCGIGTARVVPTKFIDFEVS